MPHWRDRTSRRCVMRRIRCARRQVLSCAIRTSDFRLLIVFRRARSGRLPAPKRRRCPKPVGCSSTTSPAEAPPRCRRTTSGSMSSTGGPAPSTPRKAPPPTSRSCSCDPGSTANTSTSDSPAADTKTTRTSHPQSTTTTHTDPQATPTRTASAIRARDPDGRRVGRGSGPQSPTRYPTNHRPTPAHRTRRRPRHRAVTCRLSSPGLPR